MGAGKLAKLLKKFFGKCNSFTADTLVRTENGLKPISEVKVGDKVLSYDERTETTSYQPVMAVIQGEQRYQIIKITLDSGESIETTAEHPFYIKGKGWNPANSLKVGQALQLHNGTTVVVKEVDTSVRVERVYNLTVANTHNYFVGGDGVLVHNCGKTKKMPNPKRRKRQGDPQSSIEQEDGITKARDKLPTDTTDEGLKRGKNPIHDTGKSKQRTKNDTKHLDPNNLEDFDYFGD